MRKSRVEGHEIAIPGSIGNLGAGFDTLGLAVSLYVRVRITRTIADGKGRVVCRFAGRPPVGPNLIERAFRHQATDRTTPSVEVEVRSEIPPRAGLGSSAAATIAGLRLRTLFDGARTLPEIAAVAADIEGHPDNAAASVFGGLTSSCRADDGTLHVVRWNWPEAWKVLVVTPDVQLSTHASRRVLPTSIPFEDAVFNLQRVALLLGAVQQKDERLLVHAFEDRFHQRYRQPLVPVLRGALALEHPGLLGVCLSGAGPSIVAFTRRETAGVERALRRLYRGAGVPCSIRRLVVHSPRTRPVRHRSAR